MTKEEKIEKIRTKKQLVDAYIHRMSEKKIRKRMNIIKQSIQKLPFDEVKNEHFIQKSEIEEWVSTYG